MTSAQYISFFIVLISLLAFAPTGFSGKTSGGYLYPQFYDHSCPQAQEIVKYIVSKAVYKETRMAASLIRLHFHDCFVKGCDASILLDSSGSIVSEKRSNPNLNSARGFEVLDEIKSALEKECPHTRLYNQTGNGLADSTLHPSYAAELRTGCPRSGGDQNLFFLDFVSPTKFDNCYFKNLLASKGLLSSDQILVTQNEVSMELVKKYAENNELFFEQFAKSMVKMGNISPLTGSRGEIRKNCRIVNS
ncbi:peroxidase 72-like [Tripterygium wilfordii]|uniref:peroxidase n=1 Tax=Tripterygium wilfordii TaxID=458696 RepID=A0A7J7CVQ0_TRIWF|nr:peroxidase 72-like [Tripterygium wilfordii]